MTDAVRVVKKRPYPIEAQIQDSSAGQSWVSQILKLTDVGFIMRAQEKFYKTSEEFDVRFELPALHVNIQSRVVVVKTFFHFNLKKEKELYVEMHFKNLPKEAVAKINQFVFATEPK